MVNLLKQLGEASRRQDGLAVAKLLSITRLDLENFANFTNEATVERDIKRYLNDETWASIAIAYWRVAVQVAKIQDLQSAYGAQKDLLVASNRAAEKMDNWILPVLFLIAKELRYLSILADQHSTNTAGNNEERLEEATRVINRSFTICLNDRNPNMELSRKWGVYFFIGELFKIYFKLGKRSLAKSVVKVLKSVTVDIPLLEQYPKSHSCTFLYYYGVLHFIDEDYSKAKENLEKCLNICHKDSIRNQELVLLYLIPTRLLHNNTLPSDKLWKTYPRLKLIYKDLIDSIINSDLKKFDELFKQKQSLFIKKYLYLSIEKLRFLVVARLAQKVHKIVGSPPRMPFSDFQLGLKIQGFYYEQEEVECFLTTMIYRGYLKGYLSKEYKKVILSKTDPFPMFKTKRKNTSTS